MERGRPGRIRRRRPFAAAVEAVERRALLSYLVVPRGHRVVPVHVSDARSDEPLFGNGLAFKSAPRFYGLYTGPRRPELNGVRASAYVSGTNLVLSGTVAGPIIAAPASGSQEAIYSFGIDRGGASERGPFPGREHVRFDAQVVAAVRKDGIHAYVLLTSPQTHQPVTTPQALDKSNAAIAGDTITVKVPLKLLPSEGFPIDQWNANFIVRNPAQRPNYHSVASLTPEFTDFQVFAAPTTPS